MQTNLHRVSEFAVTAKKKADDGKVKHETRAAIKRFRESDSDTELEVDEIAGSNNISTSLVDLSGQDGAAPNTWRDSFKSESTEDDTTIFLSFDWENEDPYEKAVERYFPFFLQNIILF